MNLMHDQISRELEAQLRARHIPWVPMEERGPPRTGSYLATCVNPDGRKFVSIKYWSVPVEGSQFPRAPYWADIGAGTDVLAWYWQPMPYGEDHKPWCLALDNVVGRHECDCR